MDQARGAEAGTRPFLIDGAWREGRGRSFDSIDPVDGSIAARIATAGPEDVEAAIASARRSQPAWAAARPHERARVLREIAARIDATAEDLARAQMSDNGKTLRECRSQAEAAAEVFRYYAAAVEIAEDRVTPRRGASLTLAMREPFGTVAAITPWNSPLTLEAQKLAPALAAGNAVVLKPSEVTPQVGLRYGRLALEAGLPPGLLNVLTGGPETGRALVGHPGVDLVSFTGGVSAGRLIAAASAERLCPVLLELGGKSPNIVFEDADLDLAIPGAAAGIFTSGGQSCVAGSRILVAESLFGRVVDGLVEEARGWEPGLPTEEGVRIGPMASFAHRDAVADAVAQARAGGAQVATGGAAPDDPRLAAGAFYRPTILTGLSNDAPIARTEVFGPVAVVIPFRDEAEALALANDTPFGLAAGLWSSDPRRCWRVAAALKAGTVWINGYKEGSISTPFGGWKASGFGREKGVEGLRAYSQTKGIFWRLAD